MDPLGIGVVGFGYWGPNIARNALECPATRLIGIADLRPERRDVAERRYPGVAITADENQLLAREDVEAVAITTPVSTHFPIAMRAIEAGKHVLVAKPMASSTDECDRLIEAATSAGVTLMVDHTFVYTGAVRTMAELISEGQLGEILYFDSVRINLGLFQHDVNVIWDLAAHDFAIVDHLLDAKPTVVSALGKSRSGHGMEDVAYVHTEYDDGSAAHFHVNWLSPVKIRRTLVAGTERMLVWDDLASDEKIKVYDTGIDLGNEEVPGDEGLYNVIVSYRTGDVWIPKVSPREALDAEMEHFVECVRTGATPISDGRSGRRVVEMLEAASRSLEGPTGMGVDLPVAAGSR